MSCSWLLLVNHLNIMTIVRMFFFLEQDTFDWLYHLVVLIRLSQMWFQTYADSRLSPLPISWWCHWYFLLCQVLTCHTFLLLLLWDKTLSSQKETKIWHYKTWLVMPLNNQHGAQFFSWSGLKLVRTMNGTSYETYSYINGFQTL